MLKSIAIALAAFTGLAAATTSATAADWGAYPTVDSPSVIPAEEIGTGWYLRGDIAYQVNGKPDASWGGDKFDRVRTSDSWAGAVGFGYKYDQWFRSDLTFGLDASHPVVGRSNCRNGYCVGQQDERVRIKAFDVMLNGYVDLGGWLGVTPYVGAGIGAAYVTTRDHVVKPLDGTPKFADTGSKNHWSLAAAGMAGATYDLGSGMQLDAGYRYFWIDRGAFNAKLEYKNNVSHQFRLGLRYFTF